MMLPYTRREREALKIRDRVLVHAMYTIVRPNILLDFYCESRAKMVAIRFMLSCNITLRRHAPQILQY